jgi:hypothetical protein
MLRLYTRLGLSALHFGAVPTGEVVLKQYSDAVEFWRFPVAYTDTNFSQKVQKFFFFTQPYPQCSFLDDSDMFSSVIGSSIVNKKHFVDIVAPTAQHDLSGRTAKSFPRIFLELVSFLYLEELYKRVTDQRVNHTNWIEEVIQNFPVSNNFIIRGFIRRIASQVALLAAVSFFAEQKPSMPDFLRCSLPQLLVANMFPRDDNISRELLGFWESVRSNPLVSIVDRDRIADFEFAIAALVFRDFFAVAKGTQPAAVIDQKLAKFSADGILQTLLVDLFALVTLQNRGAFVCSRPAALNIVSVLRK